jgi:ribonuclease HII
LLQIERRFWDLGWNRLAGVDEAGRGPLAGPVVAAAVVLDRAVAEAEEFGLFQCLTDSKKLSPASREVYYRRLQVAPRAEIGVGMADEREIDTLNILRATHLAMARAVRNLPALPDYIIVDGLAVEGLPCPHTAIIQGDSKSLSIAAASIVAKVVRDNRMREIARLYPQYGFAEHKGYGTAAHMRALLEYGPCSVHRHSFRPVQDAEQIRARAGNTR